MRVPQPEGLVLGSGSTGDSWGGGSRESGGLTGERAGATSKAVGVHGGLWGTGQGPEGKVVAGLLSPPPLCPGDLEMGGRPFPGAL